MRLRLLPLALAASLLAAPAMTASTCAQQADAPAATSWEALRAAYAYQPTLPDADFHRESIALRDEAGKMVPGLFLRPRAEGKYPTVLLLHGLTSDKETMADSFGRSLAARGFAVLALDAREHGERKSPGTDFGALLAPQKQGEDNAAAGLKFAAVMKGTVGDYRRALDYLAARNDVDSQRIGLLGYSMGAMMGAVLAGVDERVKAVVLEVGGDPVAPLAATVPPALRGQVDAISPSQYVGHIAPRPVLFINAQDDAIMRADAAKRLHDAAREPKQVIWAPGGHILPPNEAAKGVEWLAQKLAPAAKDADKPAQ